MGSGGAVGQRGREVIVSAGHGQLFCRLSHGNAGRNELTPTHTHYLKSLGVDKNTGAGSTTKASESGSVAPFVFIPLPSHVCKQL